MGKQFKIKAIQTRFDGYYFRSRIEARWAVFFKTLGVPYEYEKEGYELPDGTWYLCDFYLRLDKAWIEVKGERPTPGEIRKLYNLATNTNCSAAYIFFGSIPNPTTWRRTWKTVSVLPKNQPILRRFSDGKIAYALTAARAARF